MQVFLLWLNDLNTYVLGPLGFLMSVGTFILSLRINKKVNDSLDTYELNEKKEEVLKKIIYYIDLVTYKKMKKEESSQLRGFIYYMNNKYPFYSKKRENKKAIKKILQCIQEEDLSSEELQKSLISLRVNLEKVGR